MSDLKDLIKNETLNESFRPTIVNALLQVIIKDKSRWMRQEAASTLRLLCHKADFKNCTVIKTIVNILSQVIKKDHLSVCKEAVQVLDELSKNPAVKRDFIDTIVKTLLSAIKDRHKLVRQGTISALRKLKRYVKLDKGTIETIVNALSQATKDKEEYKEPL